MQPLDRHLIEKIADDTFQRRIEAERAFVAHMLKSALWVTGIALSAVAGILAFVGVQRFDDIQLEAREHAHKEVQRYINEQIALKDAGAEIDRHYGEALVRTLRVGDNTFGETLEVSRAQAERLLAVLLSPETSEILFEEAAELIARIGTETEADWLPKMQTRLIQDGLVHAEFAERYPDRRDRIVQLLSKIGTKSAAKPLRSVLDEPHLSSDSVRAILDFERRMRLESPLERSVLQRYIQRGPDDLIASARALYFSSYPNEKEARSWILALPHLRDDQRTVYAMTLRNLLHDAYSPGPTLVLNDVRQEVLTISRQAIDECSAIQLAFSEDVLLQPTRVSVTCTRNHPEDPTGWHFSIEEKTFARFIGADLNEALTMSAHELASAIDRWSSRVTSDRRLVVSARSGTRKAKITLANKEVFATSDPLSSYKLATVPDPSDPAKRLPAMIITLQSGEFSTVPAAFDAMEGFSLSAQVESPE